MSNNVVYVNAHGKPVGLRVDGKLLPVTSGTSVDLHFNDNAITTVSVTMFVPAIEVISVTSEVVEELQLELSCAQGGAK